MLRMGGRGGAGGRGVRDRGGGEVREESTEVGTVARRGCGGSGGVGGEVVFGWKGGVSRGVRGRGLEPEPS
jgi:hypothetical protein